MFIDSFGRPITYLRISVTDRCNLRCVYCLPARGVKWQPRVNLLSAQEIARVVEAAAAAGVYRIRLTGGEPLVRPDILEIITRVASVPGILEVSLTTNAMLLERLALPLAEAGLRRVNVSLDTLDAEKFRRITRGGEIARVWAGIAAAQRAGLLPIKINTVVVRGLNDDELPALARLSLEHPWHIRFIELMPVGAEPYWGDGFPPVEQRYLSTQEMRAALQPLGLQPAAAPAGNGPARTFRIPGGLGTVGFISPMSEHFCASCNRLRLTADGCLRPCLLADTEVPLRQALRQGIDVQAHIAHAVAIKPAGHRLLEAQKPENRLMAQIGG
jgi:cyclic pyranopterin phosphate synthase